MHTYPRFPSLTHAPLPLKCEHLAALISTLTILNVSLWEVHTMIPAFMLQQMVLPRKAIISLPSTILHIAIDELDLVS